MPTSSISVVYTPNWRLMTVRYSNSSNLIPSTYRHPTQCHIEYRVSSLTPVPHSLIFFLRSIRGNEELAKVGHCFSLSPQFYYTPSCPAIIPRLFVYLGDNEEAYRCMTTIWYCVASHSMAFFLGQAAARCRSTEQLLKITVWTPIMWSWHRLARALTATFRVGVTFKIETNIAYDTERVSKRHNAYGRLVKLDSMAATAVDRSGSKQNNNWDLTRSGKFFATNVKHCRVMKCKHLQKRG